MLKVGGSVGNLSMPSVSTYIMRKLAIFMKTAAFDSQPIFFRLRIMPETMPMPIQISMAPIKQIVECESCSKFCDLLMIKTETVRNCCNDCATLIKWRARFPNKRKKGSPKLIIGKRLESSSRKTFQMAHPLKKAKMPKMI